MIASSERRGTAPVEGRNVAVAPVVFRLAPMSTGLRVLTWVLMTLPCGMLCGALVVPFPGNVVLYATAAFTLLTYAGVWFMGRPSRFEVDASTLRIIWPIRTREIPRAHIDEAYAVGVADFRREYGHGMRIGAGGLWGGFGLLKTGRETFSMWISRTDEFVIVRLRGQRPLLITPENPARFIELVSPPHTAR